MSRLYDTVEPSVIDEEMLLQAVEEQGPKQEAGRIAKVEGTDFKDVKLLRLDFKNILKIDNFWEFTNLTTLQLDNNIIEKIEGMELLVNLVGLDLSFNNIEVIEGLSTLTKLEDLTLFNNRIARVESLDTLTRLERFSVGNNDLKELDKDLGYLRKFKKMKTVNMSGNPFCDDDVYKMKVIALLPHLEFLDYRLIDDQTRNAAYEKFQLGIEERLDNERKEQVALEEKSLKAGEFNLHQAAYVELLDGPSLFDSMYTEDAEGQKLSEMPGVQEHFVVFKEKFVAVCREVFDYGLLENDKRKEEVDSFWECVEEAKKSNKTMGEQSIADFMAEHKRVFLEVATLTDSKMIDTKLEEYQKKVSEVWDQLMGYELQLVDQLEEVIKEFERNMQDMVTTFIETVQGFLTNCRDLENLHHERMMEIAIVTLERVIKNELDDEISDELRMLFVDKDTINNAVNSSHDVHLLKIDNKEDDIITRINQWLKNAVEKIHTEEEIERNQKRVAEINQLIDHLREEVDNLDVGGGGMQY